MTNKCVGCKFHCESTNTCDFILIEGYPRPKHDPCSVRVDGPYIRPYEPRYES